MDDENPYRSPSVSSLESDSSRSRLSYPAERCPGCNAKVTFWMALKQGTPFRFQCGRCGSKYRVHTPFMSFVFVGVCCAIFLLIVSVYLAVVMLGIAFLIPCMPVLIAAWIALEVWTHRYIIRKGRLVPMDTREPLHAPDPAAVPKSNQESSPPTRYRASQEH
jgi:hypothetical protein